jgi:hypothetical protein
VRSFKEEMMMESLLTEVNEGLNSIEEFRPSAAADDLGMVASCASQHLAANLGSLDAASVHATIPVHW